MLSSCFCPRIVQPTHIPKLFTQSCSPQHSSIHLNRENHHLQFTSSFKHTPHCFWRCKTCSNQCVVCKRMDLQAINKWAVNTTKVSSEAHIFFVSGGPRTTTEGASSGTGVSQQTNTEPAADLPQKWCNMKNDDVVSEPLVCMCVHISSIAPVLKHYTTNLTTSSFLLFFISVKKYYALNKKNGKKK